MYRMCFIEKSEWSSNLGACELLTFPTGMLKPDETGTWKIQKIVQIGVYKNSGTPKWMVYNGNPIKNDDLGVPLFSETSKWTFIIFSCLRRLASRVWNDHHDSNRPGSAPTIQSFQDDIIESHHTWIFVQWMQIAKWIGSYSWDSRHEKQGESQIFAISQRWPSDGKHSRCSWERQGAECHEGKQPSRIPTTEVYGWVLVHLGNEEHK